MEFESGVTFVGEEEVSRILTDASLEKVCLLRLRTNGSGDRDAIFEAFRRDLPMDPPVQSARSWEALSDSLFGGLFSLTSTRVVILWEDDARHESIRAGAAAEALSILTEVAELLGSPQVTGGHTKLVAVLIPVVVKH
ncbi:hypothetical protein ACGFYY_15815 [Streptomyces sp. NPDC048331]|uniref:hypothetical protein n=1 Tax=Streptomyces sp. NPDC048331 TaxID=3365534 RepID=UPI003717FB38